MNSIHISKRHTHSACWRQAPLRLDPAIPASSKLISLPAAAAPRTPTGGIPGSCRRDQAVPAGGTTWFRGAHDAGLSEEEVTALIFVVRHDLRREGVA